MLPAVPIKKLTSPYVFNFWNHSFLSLVRIDMYKHTWATWARLLHSPPQSNISVSHLNDNSMLQVHDPLISILMYQRKLLNKMFSSRHVLSQLQYYRFFSSGSRYEITEFILFLKSCKIIIVKQSDFLSWGVHVL